MTPNKVGKGSLRAVEPKNERSPSYKGSLEIEGKKYWLSGWRRLGADGKYWLSLAVDAAEPIPMPQMKRMPVEDEQSF
jgi:hypothetical protein